MIKYNKRGFTLVEVLVSMAVFLVLITAFVVNFRNLRRSEDVRFAASELVIQLRESQSSAFNGRAVDDVIPHSFGLYFDNCSDDACSYSMFADVNGDNIYEEGIDSLIRTYSLPQGVTFLKFTFGESESVAPHSLVFQGTSAQFLADDILGEEVHVYLKHVQTNICEDVYVKGSVGQIGEDSYTSSTDGCK